MTEMLKFTLPYAYRVVAEVDHRGTTKTFYIRDRVEIGIPSVANNDVKVALHAEGWYGSENFNVERREWSGRLYARISCRDLDFVAGGGERVTRALFYQWFDSPAEPLLRIYADNRNTREVDAIPLGIRVIRENTRDETAARMKAIAAEGLLFVDGVPYCQRDMPCLALRGPFLRSPSPRERTQAGHLGVDLRDSHHPAFLRCGTSFLFAIDELEKAKDFLTSRGMGEPVGTARSSKEKTEFGIRLPEADPYWLQRSNIAIPNAINAVNVYLRAVEGHVPELGSKGMASLALLAGLRCDLEVGRAGAVFELTTELDTLVIQGFHLPKSAFQLRRTLTDLCDVSVGSIKMARDLPLFGAGQAELNTDDGLAELKI